MLQEIVIFENYFTELTNDAVEPTPNIQRLEHATINDDSDYAHIVNKIATID